jgi:hypothetical protein
MSSREKNNKVGGTRINNDDGFPTKELSLTSAEALIVLNEFRKSRCEEDKLFQLKVESLASQIDKEVKDIQKRGWLYVGIIVSVIGIVGGFLAYHAKPIIQAIITNKIVSDQVQDQLQEFTNTKILGMVQSSVSELEQRVEDCTNEIALLRLRLKAEAGDGGAYASLKNAARNSTEAARLLGDVDDYYAGKLILDKIDFARLKEHLNTINDLVTNFKEFVDSASEVVGQYERVDLSEEEIVSKIEASQDIYNDTITLIKNLAIAKPNGGKHVGLFVKMVNRTDNLTFRIAIVDCIRKHVPSCPKTVDVDLLNAWWKEICDSRCEVVL